MNCVLGCDIGSQSARALLLGDDGRVLAEAAEGYGIDHPHPLWAQQPTDRWLEALAHAVRAAVSAAGVAPHAVRAIGLAAQVDGVVAVDADGRALHPAIIWMDRRAAAECRRFRDSISEQRVFELTGLNLDPSHVAPKIAWLAAHEPAVYGSARRFLLPASFVAHALTDEYAVDFANASTTLLMDVRERCWSPEMCQLLGIDTDRLAPLVPAVAPLGGLRPAAADLLGLAPNTPVVVGTGDEHAACLGAGVLEPGIIGDIAGTAEPVCAASRVPLFDPEHLLETHCHAQADLWLIENPGFVSGANYRWLRDHLSPDEVRAASAGGPSAYQRLDLLAASVPPGCHGLLMLPCMMGAMAPTWNEDARGVFFGLTLAHTRAHLARAVLEASAFAVRDITDRMQAIGLPARELRVMGGGARSPLWNQIKADVTGLPVSVPAITETTALGAALLALVGAGICVNLDQASRLVVRIARRFEPSPTHRAAYADAYELYRQAYYSLLPVFDRAARNAPADNRTN
jgi:xylulokinase